MVYIYRERDGKNSEIWWIYSINKKVKQKLQKCYASNVHYSKYNLHKKKS